MGNLPVKGLYLIKGGHYFIIPTKIMKMKVLKPWFRTSLQKLTVVLSIFVFKVQLLKEV